jgi:XTP/dITP diphosphohydrolase
VASEDESAPFDIDDVAAGIVAKLVRRHPHVFGAPEDGVPKDVDLTSAEGVQSAWDAIKSAEKARSSALDGIPPGLPALSLAAAVAGRAGEPATGLPEVGAAVADPASLGDALFALAKAAQAAGLDPEQALRMRVRAEMTDVRVREQRGLRDASELPG